MNKGFGRWFVQEVVAYAHAQRKRDLQLEELEERKVLQKQIHRLQVQLQAQAIGRTTVSLWSGIVAVFFYQILLIAVLCSLPIIVFVGVDLYFLLASQHTGCDHPRLITKVGMLIRKCYLEGMTTLEVYFHAHPELSRGNAHFSWRFLHGCLLIHKFIFSPPYF